MNDLDAFGSSPLSRFDGVRRIAALRANALGDLLLALPALQSVKAAYPDAELVLLALDWHHAFLTGRPGPVDRVIVVPPVRGVSTPDSDPGPAEPPAAFLEAMRAERFDLALQVHGGGQYSNPFVRRLGARLTAGLRAPGAEPLDRWVHYTYYQPEVLRYLEVAGLVGAAPVTLQAQVTVTGADRQEAESVLHQAGSPATARLVAVHPGASDPRRRWPVERFARVADELAGRGAAVALTGTAAERPLTAAVAAAMLRPALDLAGCLSLGGLTGLLARCTLVVGNDTGPLHLARAVGTATVTVYWVGNLLTSGPVGRARHRVQVSWTLGCPVCGAPTMEHRCEHNPSFVSSISTQAVIDDALDLLSAPEPQM